MRLLGICLASFSSGSVTSILQEAIAEGSIIGLGELTFLQLSTRYRPLAVAGHSVGSAAVFYSRNVLLTWIHSYFAAGTGAAGLVGASIWWIVRGLGVRVGVGLSSVRPDLVHID